MSDNFFNFLIEATDDETYEPVDNDKEKDNKDISADKTDVKSNEEDKPPVETDENTGSETETASGTTSIDNQESEDNSESDSAGVDDNSSDDSDISQLEAQKKLVIYRALKELKSSYDALSDSFNLIISLNISKENREIFSLLKDKIDYNCMKLNELLTDNDIIQKRTPIDLQILFNIYTNDINEINTNIKIFINSDKNLKKTLQKIE